MDSSRILLPRIPSEVWHSTAAEADVASLDALIKAMYDVISGPAGTDRDWQRFESLYAPGSRMMRIVSRDQNDVEIEILSPHQYRASRNDFFLQTGFHEIETARRVVHYGALAHAWSTYEGRLAADGPTILRGANSIQAIRRQGRWWLLSVMWEHESPHHQLPVELR